MAGILITSIMHARLLFTLAAAAIPATGLTCRAAESPALPLVSNVEPQPLAAQIKRVTEALEYVGAPLSSAERQALDTAMAKNDETAVAEIQRVLDPHCLVSVDINPEMRV